MYDIIDTIREDGGAVEITSDRRVQPLRIAFTYDGFVPSQELRKKLCPYQISLHHSSYNVKSIVILYKWIESNLKGKWYHVMQNHYSFELEEDAIAFKLVWEGVDPENIC